MKVDYRLDDIPVCPALYKRPGETVPPFACQCRRPDGRRLLRKYRHTTERECYPRPEVEAFKARHGIASDGKARVLMFIETFAPKMILLLMLAIASPALADTWAVDYISSTSWNGKFYPSGAYFFLCCDNGGAGGVLYGLTDVSGWKYLPGYYVYGATPLVPSDIPQITLTSNAFNPGTGNYEAVAVNISGGGGGGGGVVATPELAILRRQLGLLGPRMGGKISGLFNPTLQRLTAWSAGKLLGASSWGDRIYLTDFTLQVVESCSGLMTIKWLLVLAVCCLAIGRVPWPWALAVVVAVPLIGFEVNVLRVVGIGLAYERYGWAVKEWMGWGATGLGVAQVIGLGAMARRRR